MLFQREVLDGILAGLIDRVFRHGRAPQARTGGTQRTAIKVLEFTSVEPIDDDELTEADAVGVVTETSTPCSPPRSAPVAST